MFREQCLEASIHSRRLNRKNYVKDQAKHLYSYIERTFRKFFFFFFFFFLDSRQKESKIK